jgi:hypothetical protein
METTRTKRERGAAKHKILIYTQKQMNIKCVFSDKRSINPVGVF